MMTFLLVVHGLLALALVGVILMQKSEGGGLTSSSSGGGLVSARGAADLLTRTTAILATLFIVSSLGLAMLAAATTKPRAIDTSLARQSAPSGPLGAPSPAGPLGPPVPAAPAPGAQAPVVPPLGPPTTPADEVPIAQ